MEAGVIKSIKVNPKTDKAAILFEDGKAYYVESTGMIKGLMNSFKYGNPIGEIIEYELSNEKIDGEGVIKRIFAKGVTIG